MLLRQDLSSRRWSMLGEATLIARPAPHTAHSRLIQIARTLMAKPRHGCAAKR
jgi:hypothetical protein